jgi:hypothetical protein
MGHMTLVAAPHLDTEFDEIVARLGATAKATPFQDPAAGAEPAEVPAAEEPGEEIEVAEKRLRERKE